MFSKILVLHVDEVTVKLRGLRVGSLKERLKLPQQSQDYQAGGGRRQYHHRICPLPRIAEQVHSFTRIRSVYAL